MLLTQLEYFVALPRERHFGRAAAACYVSSSALSEAVRKLETELGVPLVRRGRTFEGLTSEGERVLSYAQTIVHTQRALLDDLSDARGQLTAHLRMGTIPAASAAGSAILAEMSSVNPGVTATMATGLSSTAIVDKLRTYELDAGVILPAAADEGSGKDLHQTAWGEVSHVVVASARLMDAGLMSAQSRHIRGRQLERLPLVLLTPDMRARQILDEQMRANGIHLVPRLEVDSVEAAVSLARDGGWAAVVPESTITERSADPEMRVLGLTDPHVSLPLAVVRLAERPVSALGRALDEAVATALATKEAHS